jgi:hypothetical protein
LQALLADYFPIKSKRPAMNEMKGMPYLKTLALCLQKVIADGYVHDFCFADDGIVLQQNKKIYKPADVKVINVLKFEGDADPENNAILYTIETNDGVKGTLVDALGIYGKEKMILM